MTQTLFKRKLVRQLIKIVSISILLVTFLIASISGYTIRQSWPQETGTIQLPGLQKQVEVLRDAWGIAHIYADNAHDLFMAQGYIHAQERFWQMDFWRHLGSGRLAQMFGKSQLNTDKMLRTVGWARVAQQELEQMDATTKNLLQAYADGVNAYLSKHQNSALSLEYAALKLLNPNYKPEPWQILHSLTWGKVMSYNLGRNLGFEIERSILLKTLTRKQIDELFPPYPDDHPVIVANVDKDISQTQDFHNEDTTFDAFSPALESIRASWDQVATLAGSIGSGIGSNSWVISGKLTTTGKPFLANDPHLGEQIPSIWYENGLHCIPKTTDCPYDVTGFSFAGMAGIIIGHNDRIAWGMTSLGPDVMDLYIEKVNPENPNQYELNGKWVDMEVVKETIQVAGGKSVSQTIRYTSNGPIISDTYESLENFNKKAGISLPKNYALALRWTALEPSKLATAIFKINRSQNWQEFRFGVKDFDAPAQNFVYADTSGNIGYQMSGKIPIRAKGDGRYPVLAWINGVEWLGYIPFEQLPSVFNPESGYIAAANNAVVDKDYPYLITADWHYGFRAQRIVEMIEGEKQQVSLDNIQKMQADNKNLIAEILVPILLQIPLKNNSQEKVQHLLVGWNFQQNADSTAAAIFAVFWKHLLAETFNDQLPQAYLSNGDDRWFEVIRRLVKQPLSPWWDNQKTRGVENREQIFRQAFAKAVDELKRTLGEDTSNWYWGKLHTVTFHNQSLGKSIIAPIEALFNRGPFPCSGGNSIVNATDWNPAKGYTVTSLPSMRMIVDLANWDKSVAIHTTGQSGHAFHPNYDNMIQRWNKFEYIPLLWRQDTIKANSHTSLILHKHLLK